VDKDVGAAVLNQPLVVERRGYPVCFCVAK
jgi:hypothetical protein